MPLLSGISFVLWEKLELLEEASRVSFHLSTSLQLYVCGNGFYELYHWAFLPSNVLLGFANGENLPEIKGIFMSWWSPSAKDLSFLSI